MLRYILITLIIGLLCSCQKYAEKIAGEYTGQLTRNDTLIDQNASVNLTEVDKKRISIQSPYFNTYLTDINKQRYFASVSYYSTDTTGALDVEVYDDGLMVFYIRDQSENIFTYSGNRNN
ncbi:MAG: hypothetical protein VXY28_08470 [Bacteroidota bacterium]|nr:hypothetical protein [Bacteroidota bacterium]